MADTAVVLPPFVHSRISLPSVLLKLTEQLPEGTDELLCMQILQDNGEMIDVTLQRTTEQEEERLLIEITDVTGHSVVESEESQWNLRLGTIQNPVYLKNCDQVLPCQEPMSAQVLSEQPEVLAQLEMSHGEIPFESGTVASLKMEEEEEPSVINESPLTETHDLDHIIANSQTQDPGLSSETLTEGTAQILTEQLIEVGLENAGEEGVSTQSVILLSGDGTEDAITLAGEDLDRFIVFSQGTELKKFEDGSETESKIFTPVVTAVESEWTTEICSQTPTNIEGPLEEPPEMSTAENEGNSQDNVKTFTDGDPVESDNVVIQSVIKINNVKDIPRIVVDVPAYNCSLCSKICQSMKVLLSHRLRKHGQTSYSQSDITTTIMKDMFACYICQQTFRNFASVTKHLENIHKMVLEKQDLIRLIQCPICQSRHTSYHTLKCHLRYKHSQDPQFQQAIAKLQTQIQSQSSPKKAAAFVFECPWCSQHLTSKQFKHHLRIVHPDEPGTASAIAKASSALKDQNRQRIRNTLKMCAICKKEYPLTVYYAHMRRKHQYSRKDLTELKCDVCSVTFSSKWHQDMHQKIHSDERNFKCDQCGSAFRHKYALKTHIDVVHHNIYPFTCQTCQRGFHKKNIYLSHTCDSNYKKKQRKPTIKSSGLSVYVRKQDKPVTKRKTEVKVETSTEESKLDLSQFIVKSDKNFCCQMCGKVFSSRMSISTHLRRVHHKSKKPIEPLTCDVCQKTFILPSKLKTHMLSHGEGTLQCSQCSKSFKTRASLREHVTVVHLHQYRHHCQNCRLGFQKRSYLLNHKCGKSRRSGIVTTTLTDRPSDLNSPDTLLASTFKKELPDTTTVSSEISSEMLADSIQMLLPLVIPEGSTEKIDAYVDDDHQNHESSESDNGSNTAGLESGSLSVEVTKICDDSGEDRVIVVKSAPISNNMASPSSAPTVKRLKMAVAKKPDDSNSEAAEGTATILWIPQEKVQIKDKTPWNNTQNSQYLLRTKTGSLGLRKRKQESLPADNSTRSSPTKRVSTRSQNQST